MAKASPSNCVVLRRFCFLKWTVAMVVCAAGSLVLWPWSPELKIERMSVKRVRVHPLPPVGADVWITLSVVVKNRGMYWLDLADVDVGVKYRGKKMGHVESEGWHVRGWASTNVDGDLEFSGLPSTEVAHLLEDMAKGEVYFHTVIEVAGEFGFLSIPVPLTFKIILACEVLVNTKSHAIILQHCIYKLFSNNNKIPLERSTIGQ
ncbi:uncharacterized protein HKW66_Vig0165960 [Vigna angularis]|uniref:Late embryogenesis abundant protein LEA-2 subgroup domain-containing protein n=1 Tax=Phaseolus angularis TaxID=3914 RepID=A0A8T0JRD8_PHAAN|nr:uncharacterized protein HKW66_Vig0165960 [Vigna angularis]